MAIGRAGLLVAALALNVAASTFLAYDGVDRILGAADHDAFDPSIYWFSAVFGAPTALALFVCVLRRGLDAVHLTLGAIAVLLATLAVPLYGLGLFYLPSATLTLIAGLRR